MKRYVAMSFLALALTAIPCQAQFMKQLEQTLLGGQGQGQQLMPGQQIQATVVGNVNLPPGQYMMTNTQTGQAFYVAVQNGQMFLTGQPMAPQMMAPGQGLVQPQQGGMGGLVRSGLGNFLQNKLAPQQVPEQ